MVEEHKDCTHKEDYLLLVKNTQIVSVNMIVFNNVGQVLLGYRNDPPARSKWSVPGGRVYKHEKIPDAVRRVTKEQLGHEFEHDEELGVFHHSYDDNFDNEHFGTRCIVFAVAIHLKKLVKFVKNDQHAVLHWWNVPDLKTNACVQQYTKDYFHLSPPNRIFKN
jgi:colanic acid biosynthesis protein WcaH